MYVLQVSGLPIRNNDQHAAEVASMSLHLVSEVQNFTVKHRPTDKLKLRIGIHSGITFCNFRIKCHVSKWIAKKTLLQIFYVETKGDLNFRTSLCRRCWSKNAKILLIW